MINMLRVNLVTFCKYIPSAARGIALSRDKLMYEEAWEVHLRAEIDKIGGPIQLNRHFANGRILYKEAWKVHKADWRSC